MLYLLQCQIYACMMYAVYQLFLRNQASHTWNRIFLMLCAVLPLILPFVHIPGIGSNIAIETDKLAYALPDVVVFSGHHEKLYDNSVLMDQVFTTIYISGSLILLILFAFQYLQFRQFISKSNWELLDGDIKLIKNCNYGPGSFGRYVFFPGSNADPAILQHELAHVQHKHSSDIVLMRLLQCLFWPNAMLYVIMKELKTIHEFEADNYSAGDKEVYIRSMLNGIFGTNRFSLSHTFFHHPIKRRIVMLQKTPQSRNTLRTAINRSGIAALVLVAGLIYLQSCNRQKAVDKDILQQRSSAESNKSGKIDPAIAKKIMEGEPTGPVKITQENGVYNYVDQMPVSSVDIPSFLGEHINYPAEAKANGLEGKVIVKFIIDEEGNLKSPVVLRSPGQSLSDEAIRVLLTMPRWKPGKLDGKSVPVYFTIPINFKLE
jgi:TonB family protein